MMSNSLPHCPAPSSPEQFQAYVAEKWKWMQEYMQEKQWRPYNWKAPPDATDILMWVRPTPDCPIDSVKATVELPCSVEDALQLAQSIDADLVRLWDPDIVTLQVHKRIDENLYVALSSYSLPWPLYPRRFLTAQRVMRMADGGAVLMCASVNDAAVPLEGSHVRGEVRGEAWLFESLKGGSACKFTRAVCADPRGALPAFVVNGLNGGIGTGMHGFRNVILKNKQRLR